MEVTALKATNLLFLEGVAQEVLPKSELAVISRQFVT